MRIIENTNHVRIFFFIVLAVCFYNYIGQSSSYTYVRSYFGVTKMDAYWLLRSFHAATIITSIAGLVFIKWLGNRWLFICSALIFICATLISFSTKSFSTLLCARITAGFANGFMMAVATQLFLATYVGPLKTIGSVITIAATIAGLCIGLAATSMFNEDYGWSFNYLLSVPIMTVIFIAAFFFIPVYNTKEEVEEDWFSLIPFTVLIFSLLYCVMYWQEFGRLGSPYILTGLIVFCISATILFIRGFTQVNPIFDTRLFKYPSFIATFFISFLSGAVFVFNFTMIANLLGGIMQMSFQDVLIFVSFLSLILFLFLLLGVILLAKKINATILMIAGLVCIAYSSWRFSLLDAEFNVSNIITPAILGMAGAALVALTVVIIALKSVPQTMIGKVTNFRSVLFPMGIAYTAVDLNRILEVKRVTNYNAMLQYTDPGNPYFQQRFSGFQAFYRSNGYDAEGAYQAAIHAMTGTLKMQAYFKGMIQIFQIATWICIAFACLLGILWLSNNYKLLLSWFTKNKTTEHAQNTTQ